MKSPYKELLGILVLGDFISLLAYGLNYLQRPTPLENIEKRMDEAADKEVVLTDNEKKLKQQSEDKDWEELEKETDK